MLGISPTGKLDENQRSRQLLKVLAISDVVIFKTRFVASILFYYLFIAHNRFYIQLSSEVMFRLDRY